MVLYSEPDSLKKSYDHLAPLANKFRQQVVEQLQEILSSAGIALAVPIESRVKTWDSLTGKLERRALDVSSLAEISDFVGIRLILLFRRDVEPCCSAIADAFEIVNSEDTSDRLGDSEFGYQSVHYQVKIPTSWHSIPSFSSFKELSTEIQIRTASQHIWAAASHVLQYKNEANVPSPIRRSIHRVSALLETVDLEFERVLQDRESYRGTLDSQEQDARLNVGLVCDILDELLPEKNKLDDEDYSGIVDKLQSQGIDTVSQLRDMIGHHLQPTLDLEERIVSGLRKGDFDGDMLFAAIDGQTYGGEKSTIDEGVFLAHTGIVREMLASVMAETMPPDQCHITNGSSRAEE